MEKYFSSAEEKKNGKGKDLDQGKYLSLRKGGKYIENENIFFCEGEGRGGKYLENENTFFCGGE